MARYENDLLIHTDKGYYVGGEIIYGHIFLNIVKPTAAHSLCFELKGYESVFWQESHQESYTDSQNNTQWRTVTHDYKAHKDFFKDHFTVMSYHGGFPPGSYSFPFQYRLPADLPGVFRKKSKQFKFAAVDKFKASIQYKIKAILEGHKHDLVAKQQLTIYSKLGQPIAPKRHQKTAEVRTLCCIPRGPVSVEAFVDKNSYLSGETAQVHVKVDNNSTVPVNHFNTKLFREIIVNNGKGRTKVLRKLMSEARYEGCPPAEHRSKDVPLVLRSRKRSDYLKPSTKSNFIECRYFVLIEMDIPWAPDIEIPSPITIYAPQNQIWASWQPPAWALHAAPQNVCAGLAVPGEVLAARVQNGVFVPPPPVPMPFEVPTNYYPQQADSNFNERSPLLA